MQPTDNISHTSSDNSKLSDGNSNGLVVNVKVSIIQPPYCSEVKYVYVYAAK